MIEEVCTGINEPHDGMVGLRWSGQQGGIHGIERGDKRVDAVELFDATGRGLTATTTVYGPMLTVNMAGMATGIYVVRLHCAGRTGTLHMVHMK